MSVRVGDAVFRGDGVPGIVKQQNEEKSTLTVAADPKEVRENFRHGYINGMAEADRGAFNAILDEARSKEDPRERVTFFQGKIQELETNEPVASRDLVRYLKSEMAHLIHSKNVAPREYTMPARDIRF